MSEADADDDDAAAPAATHPWLAFGGLAMVTAYAFLIRPLGFIPSTFVFGVAFLLLLGERRWWMVAGLPLAANAAILGVFTRVLVVPLPRGSGPFLEFSTWLY